MSILLGISLRQYFIEDARSVPQLTVGHEAAMVERRIQASAE